MTLFFFQMNVQSIHFMWLKKALSRVWFSWHHKVASTLYVDLNNFVLSVKVFNFSYFCIIVWPFVYIFHMNEALIYFSELIWIHLVIFFKVLRYVSLHGVRYLFIYIFVSILIFRYNASLTVNCIINKGNHFFFNQSLDDINVKY